ncbi:MAG: MogA/MoaB family molybdenum cofactor biosynthesis protein [Clostridia bacterium]|nr:MogA/MoaB family molybdenum cofactor biosynthesis protein [Clostridia bacterium]NCD02045.1 MogA/MoaB family molybdenum cofactor biosynthesis protein [Clostridia bacterium]
MFRTAIITASDKGYAGIRQDESGALIEAMLDEDYEVVCKVILPDDRKVLADEMRRLCVESVDLILTTGGTGFSERDVTPEATRDVVERLAPGIGQAMMFHSLSITPRAMLSRQIAGICGHTLIINLPGSPKAVKENLEYILGPLKHGIEILKGEAGECGKNI